MPDIAPRPNFARFLDTLLLRRAYVRPPVFDFHVDAVHKSRLIGRPWRTPADDVEFWRLAGYDYVQFPIYVPHQELRERRSAAQEGAASHGSDLAVIESLEQFRSRRWSWQDVAEGNLSAVRDRLDWAAQLVAVCPDEMKVILHTADIFTFAWEMIGFTQFCLASVEQPQFLQEVMESLARGVLNVAQAAVEVLGPKLGAVFYSDDIAYSEGLMLSPAFFAEFLFPHIEALGKVGRGAPLIYHTDGRLYDVFDHFARIGVKGVQPLEPKSMDPLEIKRRWPRQFCLMGNVDLDLMSRGSTGQVEAHVRDRIERLHFGRDPDSPYPGGYMVGVSNTVPYYVNHEHYVRMLEIVHALDPSGRQEL